MGVDSDRVVYQKSFALQYRHTKVYIVLVPTRLRGNPVRTRQRPVLLAFVPRTLLLGTRVRNINY